jgi:hypothetical protein
MTSWEVVRRRIRRPRTSKRNGKRRVSRRICIPVPRGKEASSLRNLLLRSHLQLPSQQYPLLHQHLTASHPGPQVLHLLLPTPHRLPHQPWQLIPQINRANPLYLLAHFGKTMLARENFEGSHAWPNRGTLPQDAQNGHPARPQRVKGRGVPSGAHGATNKEHHVCARRRVVRRPGPR